MTGPWFYGTQQQRQGPVSQAELADLARTGRLHPMVLVWTDGMPQWMAAGQMPFLFPQGMPAQPASDGGALNLLLPFGPQSGLSMAAGYVGLVALLMFFVGPFELIISVTAIVLGVFGLRDIAAHPQKRGKGRAITGIVLGAIGAGLALWAFSAFRR